MTTVTADDIRVLAQSNEENPVLALVGEDVTDVEAEVIAAALTASLPQE